MQIPAHFESGFFDYNIDRLYIKFRKWFGKFWGELRYYGRLTNVELRHHFQTWSTGFLFIILNKICGICSSCWIKSCSVQSNRDRFQTCPYCFFICLYFNVSPMNAIILSVFPCFCFLCWEFSHTHLFVVFPSVRHYSWHCFLFDYYPYCGQVWNLPLRSWDWLTIWKRLFYIMLISSNSRYFNCACYLFIIGYALLSIIT